MTLHRRLTFIAVGVGAVMVLAGCATGATSPTAPSTDPQDGGDALSGVVEVSAAASLQGAFADVAAAFQEQHPGVTVRAAYDGSSTLATQIQSGAPVDVFASADENNMAKVADLALDPQIFATNTLVIATPADNPGDVATLADLADVTTVLCAPEVPCGAASQTLLAGAGVTVQPASLEQNVTAVLAKVAAGEADAGLVYATDVIGADGVASLVPDGADEVVNRYPIAALADAPNRAAAGAFVEFVLSEEGQAILTDYGFGSP